jgi:hypothetical protein
MKTGFRIFCFESKRFEMETLQKAKTWLFPAKYGNVRSLPKPQDRQLGGFSIA